MCLRCHFLQICELLQSLRVLKCSLTGLDVTALGICIVCLCERVVAVEDGFHGQMVLVVTLRGGGVEAILGSWILKKIIQFTLIIILAALKHGGG